jgi:PadR family transcriptional regulator PadR
MRRANSPVKGQFRKGQFRLTDSRFVPHSIPSCLGDSMGKVKGDVLQGTLDLLILKTLAAGPMHGYGIASRIEQVSEELLRVEEGSLYPALHRIQQTGWIRAQWKRSENGRPAKFYRLTSAGLKQLQAEEKRWQKLTRGVSKVLRFVEG